jgi:hypothetical protein
LREQRAAGAAAGRLARAAAGACERTDTGVVQQGDVGMPEQQAHSRSGAGMHACGRPRG